MNWTSILSTFEFGLVFGIIAVGIYAALSTGLLSFASIAFGACGAFLFVHAADTWGVPFPIALALSAIIGAVAALVLSALVLHLSSHYIAMATVAVLLITRVAVLNLPAATGGVNGMPVLTDLPLLYTLISLAVVAWIFWRLRRSRYGIAAEVVREDTTVAVTLGISVRAIQTMSFTLSGLVGGLGGGLLASTYGYIDAETFSMDLAFVGLAAVVLGGAFHWVGALVGGIVFTILPELLRGFIDQADQIVNGLILIIIMIFLPRGLADPLRWRTWLRQRGAHPGDGRDGTDSELVSNNRGNL